MSSSSSSSTNPLTFQSVISTLCIAAICFLITEALDHTIYAILIPICFVVFPAGAIVSHSIAAGRFSSLFLFQTQTHEAWQEGFRI